MAVSERERLRQFRRSPWARRFPELLQLPDSALAALLRAQDPSALEAALTGHAGPGTDRAAAAASGRRAPPPAPPSAARQEASRLRFRLQTNPAGGSGCGTPTYFVTLRRRSRGADAQGLAPLPGGVAHWGWSGGGAGGERLPGAGAPQRAGARTAPAAVGQAAAAAAAPPRPGTTASCGLLSRLRGSGPAPLWRPISQCPCWRAASSGSGSGSGGAVGGGLGASSQLASRIGAEQRAFRPASAAEAKAAIRWPADALSLPPPPLMAALRPAHPSHDPAGAALHGRRVFVPSGVPRAHSSGRAAAGFFCNDPPPTSRRPSKSAAVW
ncbi:hypothetical protein Rsub_09284 [Raphidocelis subcapitata]|uniref:Uncharacterized protein n=1 Tax=Raphidocelis subcapitata TaxID=307507 RepID=A0A2V0P9Y2_9CHLO|nr:hypothetical protein Rsub_09284 [Raphidocelis subcapitata]|eukprot:GBF96651.1 hypothetical protein Rsub_09284 [Raphidocelis subcapitata]